MRLVRQRRIPLSLATVSIAVTLAGLGVLAARTAVAAASCARMSVDFSGVQLTLNPSAATVAHGGCVEFVNNTHFSVSIVVAKPDGSSENGWPRSVPAGGKTSYVGTVAGRHGVTAVAGPGPTATAHGSITVEAAPQPSHHPRPPARSPSSTAPPATSSPGPSQSGSGPQVAPTPSTPSRSPSPRQSVPVTPRSPGSSVVPPANPPTPQPSATAVVSGPLEPASSRSAGLPAAVAALAVVGVGAGLARVLLAEPVSPDGVVDNPPKVGGSD